MSPHRVSPPPPDDGDSQSDDGDYIPERPDPAFSRPTSAPWTLEIPYADAKKMIEGFRPRQMEDRWEFRTMSPEDGGMYTTWLIRSWTDYSILALRWQADLDADGELTANQPVVLKELLWETDRSRWNVDPDTPLAEHKDLVRTLFRHIIQVELPAEA